MCLKIRTLRPDKAFFESIVRHHNLALLQVERLQRKFTTIHSTLAQQQTSKPAHDSMRTSAATSVSHSAADNLSKVCSSGSVSAELPILYGFKRQQSQFRDGTNYADHESISVPDIFYDKATRR